MNESEQHTTMYFAVLTSLLTALHSLNDFHGSISNLSVSDPDRGGHMVPRHCINTAGRSQSQESKSLRARQLDIAHLPWFALREDARPPGSN
jgi:hypothetical protein